MRAFTESLYTADVQPHYFFSAWRMQNTWSVVYRLHGNPRWWSSKISSTYGVKTLTLECLIKCMQLTRVIPRQLLQSLLSPLLQIGKITDSLYCSGNSSLFLTQSVSQWISERNVFPPAWINSDRIWLVSGEIHLFSFLTPIVTSRS